MIKKILLLIILSLATISCDSEPQEKTYTIVLDKEEYEKRVAEIENEIKNKNYKKAEEMLLEIAKYNKAAYVRIATMYYEAGKTDESEKWFKIAYDKGNKEVAGSLGDIYSERREYGKAEQYYREYIKLGNLEGYKNLGYMFERQGKIDEATKLYIEGAKSKDAHSIYSLVRIYYLKNDIKNVNYWKDKLLNDTEVIDFDSDMEKYLNYLNGSKKERKIADLYIKSAQNMIIRNLSEAENEQKEMIKYSQDELVNLAGFYNVFGDKSAGKRLFKEAYEKELKDSIYYMGVIEFEEGNIEKAREYFKESAIKENRAEAQIGYADKLKEEENIEEAVKWYKKAAEQKEARALIELCSYYLDKRDIEKANEMVRRLKTTKGLKNYTLEYKKFAHEYKELK
ncbi:tetratricopeptide repeat protein [Leptotrichia hofstadii]|uniref:Tetratricopeptide repeat protein n=1 Tax=Leptotrichia hofstadii TaxID=157688 RepID=A0A510JJM8_9FUSO|nr:tetratricopeptide repeat protein [Leptotrichia hofstadii]BBM39509.1 tetratricopeptide repeat protein [Leptotrichia hofstadii]